MPELPEVHTISSDLNQHISGFTITDVKVLGTYKVLPDQHAFFSGLKDQKILEVKRIAKNIVVLLDNEKALHIHLAMTGQVFVRDPKEKVPNWTRVVLRLSKNGASKIIYLTDMRMFGKIGVMDQKGLENLKNKYGPEPLDNITPSDFLQRLQQKNTSVKNALLEQSLVSGLGNIYATDALFMAGIHPETPTKKLTLQTATKLLESSREILLEGIKHRGSTLDDKMYVDIFGKEGTHQKHFRIYGKSKCPNCGGDVEFKKIGGRGTYFCPVCQTVGEQSALF
jgi:formamidopyrimidine-DNA glycosylase